MACLPRRAPEALSRSTPERVDGDHVRRLLDELSSGGEPSLRRLAGLTDEAALLIGRDELERALLLLGGDERALLARAARRVELFAREQLGAWHAHDAQVSGGRAGQRLVPLARAGVLARPGRVGDVLQGVATARVAGVEQVVLACDAPGPAMLAAAAVARADAVLVVGGALGAAALGLGLGLPAGAVDVVAGPTDALGRALLAALPCRARVLGGAAVLVLADRSAAALPLAAELLTLIEDGHGPLTVASPSAALLDELEAALAAQLADHDEDGTLAAALSRSQAVQLGSLDDALPLCRQLAPGLLLARGADAEHLAADLQPVAHVDLGASLPVPGAGAWLPADGTSAWQGPLSVTAFLRIQTWTRREPGPGLDDLLDDARDLATLEGRRVSARLLDGPRTAGGGKQPQLQPAPEPRRAPPGVATQVER